MLNFTLILGGAASGKSLFAESLLLKEADVTYVATVKANDKEMQAKVKQHQKRRPSHWQTVEIIKSDLPHFLKKTTANCLLIDDFGTYVAQVMESKTYPKRHLTNLIKALELYRGQIVAVSQEVGLGIVPLAASARSFRELLGWFNQQLAGLADRVFLVVAGQTVLIKGQIDKPILPMLFGKPAKKLKG
jgi:adenosylcobinamide kinase/adenosylcobinamide-phosphate guanylyltransferase